MKFIKISKNTIYKELCCWLGLILFTSTHYVVQGPPLAIFVYTFIYILNFALAYYILFLLVFPNFFEANKLIFVINYLFVITLFVSIDYVHLKIILPQFGGHVHRATFDDYTFIKHSLIPFCFVGFASLGSYLNWRSLKRFKIHSQQEKDILNRELLFVKNQFNSHLTFNFLNFCYSKGMHIEKLSEPIENFTELLRYSLKSSLTKYISIQDEVEYINRYIAIQQCLTSKLFVQFDHKEINSDVQIVAGLLAVLVENAFKHGEFSESENPILINLTVISDDLNFQVWNKIPKQKISISTGIGLKNLKQVLDFYYENKYELNIKKTENTYQTKLHIKLK
jgi:hypothetical protein